MNRGLTAAAMRQAFDESFSRPTSEDSQAWADFLLIRLEQQLHALRLAEILGLRQSTWITPLPGATAALLGLSGHEGRVLPVYDLAVLVGKPGLGGAGKATGQAGAWQLVTREPALLLSIAHFERHIRCPLAMLAPVSRDGQGDAASGHAGQREALIDGQLQTEAGLCPLISIPAVLTTIQDLARQAHQERR